jgi:hypothetical protein
MPHDELPDPEGEPIPEKKDLFGTAIWISFAALLAFGFLAPALFGRGACRGASRSSRVKWTERQEEIDQSISTQNNEPNPASGTKR